MAKVKKQKKIKYKNVTLAQMQAITRNYNEVRTSFNTIFDDYYAMKYAFEKEQGLITAD